MLKTGDGLDRLLSQFQEQSGLALTSGGSLPRLRRFRHPNGARAFVARVYAGEEANANDAPYALRIAGPDDKAVAEFEEALLDCGGRNAFLPVFHTRSLAQTLLRELDYLIAKRCRWRIIQFSVEPVRAEVVDQLIAIGEAVPFSSRDFPSWSETDFKQSFWMGGPGWGVRLKLRRGRGHWIAVERIESSEAEAGGSCMFPNDF